MLLFSSFWFFCCFFLFFLCLSPFLCFAQILINLSVPLSLCPSIPLFHRVFFCSSSFPGFSLLFLRFIEYKFLILPSFEFREKQSPERARDGKRCRNL
ncbi:hypothetical protein BDV24DRAFT_140640 [Aspergillus arachidicola]|uniref:Uncharacterized protein n=1 Tax=Aspergillus arachidicola TaxID=656916 RepID=A0A5N6XV14_9EURO|nr:hypothetical protein BDV24DRAFT_140640 [Aspergillus arachidicola]